MRWIFRCDATSVTGLGHLSRCLALAECARDEGITSRFCGEYSEVGVALLRDAAMEHGEWTGDVGGAQALIADSYALTPDAIAGLQRLAPVVVLDDFCQLPVYPCAGVLNVTIGAPRLSYPGLVASQCALGPAYFPARESLRRLRAKGSGRTTSRIEHLLVVIGGGDRYGLAARVVAQVPAPIHVRAIWTAAGAPPILDRPVEWLLPTSDMASQFAWADACVTGGGLLKYESAYLGLPTAIVSQTAAQQSDTVVFCHAGLALDLGYLPEPEALRHSLHHFLDARTRRNDAIERAAATFPIDSTQNAVRVMREWT